MKDMMFCNSCKLTRYDDTNFCKCGIHGNITLPTAEWEAMKADKARIDWLESSEQSHGFCHAGYGDYIYYAHQEEGYPTVRQVIDAVINGVKV